MSFIFDIKAFEVFEITVSWTTSKTLPNKSGIMIMTELKSRNFHIRHIFIFRLSYLWIILTDMTCQDKNKTFRKTE